MPHLFAMYKTVVLSLFKRGICFPSESNRGKKIDVQISVPITFLRLDVVLVLTLDNTVVLLLCTFQLNTTFMAEDSYTWPPNTQCKQHKKHWNQVRL